MTCHGTNAGANRDAGSPGGLGDVGEEYHRTTVKKQTNLLVETKSDTCTWLWPCFSCS